MFKQSKITLMVALSLAGSGQLMAAEEAATLDDLVVTGTRAESPLLEQAGNTGKVSQEEIDLVRPDHVTEVVNRISGVNVQHGNGQEHLTSIRSPVLSGGAGAGSFLFLEDGIALRAPGFANVTMVWQK